VTSHPYDVTPFFTALSKQFFHIEEIQYIHSALDTVTMGLLLWREPSDDPRQPHLIDVCALLYGADGALIYLSKHWCDYG
jgi:hypothetical protein